MKWSCIYEVDFYTRDATVSYFKPKGSMWKLTERGKSEVLDDDDATAHRKYVGLLTEGQFMKFLYELPFGYSGVSNTLGMLGAVLEDGVYPGIIPAWSIEISSLIAFADLYVCPLNETEEERELLQKSREEDIRKLISDIASTVM